MPRCVVVLGPPCAGKSILAARLAGVAGWALLAKDVYKEAAFAELGVGDREWSSRLSALAWELLYAAAARCFSAGRDCVLEGNFRATQGERLRALAATVPDGVDWLELRVRAAPEVLAARFAARAGARHPGHRDADYAAGQAPGLAAELAAPTPALGLGGASFEWDTTAGFDTEAALSVFAAWRDGATAHAGRSHG